MLSQTSFSDFQFLWCPVCDYLRHVSFPSGKWLGAYFSSLISTKVRVHSSKHWVLSSDGKEYTALQYKWYYGQKADQLPFLSRQLDLDPASFSFSFSASILFHGPIFMYLSFVQYIRNAAASSK